MAPNNSPSSPDARSNARYAGPRDVGRAESLYHSALSKPDLDYSTHLLFSALVANPEHEEAMQAILGKLPAFAAQKRKMVVRVSELLNGSPADGFVKSVAAFCASPRNEETLACAIEAQKIGLPKYSLLLGSKLLQQLETGDTSMKAPFIARLIDLFESAAALAPAARTAQVAARLFPDDQALREREKNLLASKYLEDTDIASATTFQEIMRDRSHQEAMHRPVDSSTRIDELEQRYAETHSLEDFRELVRALRESSPARREAALTVLEDGLKRFADKETRWFIREIDIERRWAEIRVHKRLVDESPADSKLSAEHESLRSATLQKHVDYLYEIVSALPAGPDRNKRQLELSLRLFDARRFEEAIKQAQSVKRRPESRLDAWVVMAKSFVQLGLTIEAGECFQNILSELNASSQGSIEKVLEARYAYAQFLTDESARKRDAVLARHARKLCSDIMVEDIDYRDVRKLAARADALLAEQ